MSDYRAVGGVMETLRTLLKDRMEVPGVKVTAITPQADEKGQDAKANRVNLFLYRVTQNSSFRNQEIPGQGHPAAYGFPPLGLDLHFLLTAYGTSTDTDGDNERQAHFLLGSAMRVFHDFGLITDNLVQVRGADVGKPVLHESLIGEFEKIKLTADTISLEDLSKIWTALTVPYRLSAAYQASVVLIESQRERSFPKLVGKPPEEGPRIYALPFHTPRIDRIQVRPAGPPQTLRLSPYAGIGDTLEILGMNLSGDNVRVFLGSVDVTAHLQAVTADRLTVLVPDDDRLQPGPQAVRVTLDVLMGEPPTVHTGFNSNLGVFMLIPSLSEISPISGPSGTDVTISGRRLFAPGLATTLLIGDAAFAVTDPPPPAPPVQQPDQIQVTVSGLPLGIHPVRVRVNGAESLETNVTFEVL